MDSLNERKGYGREKRRISNQIYTTNRLDVNKIHSGYLVWDKTDNLWKYKDEAGVIHSVGTGTGGTPVFDNAKFDNGAVFVGRPGVLPNVITFQAGTKTVYEGAQPGTPPSQEAILQLPSGGTGQRPVPPAAGMMRLNTDTNKFEGYTTAWGDLGGAGTDPAFNTVTYTPITPAPTAPVSGMVYNDQTKGLLIWDGTTWNPLGGDTLSPIIYKGTTKTLTDVPAGVPAKGDYYVAGLDGDHTGFVPPVGGVTGVFKGDHLIYDGAKWVVKPAVQSTPGGDDTQIQYNNNGKLDANAGLTYTSVSGSPDPLDDYKKISVTQGTKTLDLEANTEEVKLSASGGGSFASKNGDVTITGKSIELVSGTAAISVGNGYAEAPFQSIAVIDAGPNRVLTTKEWVKTKLKPQPPLPPTVSVTPTQPELQAIQDYIKAIDDLAGTLGITTGVTQPGLLPPTPTLAQLQGILDFAKNIDDQFAVLVVPPKYTPAYTKPARPIDYVGTPTRQQLYDLLNYAIAISNAMTTSNIFGAAFPVDSVNGRTGAIMLSLGDVGITPTPEPAIPGDPGGTYNQAAVQAILDYSKAIANILKSSGILT